MCPPELKGTACVVCGRSSHQISRALKVCASCIKRSSEEALAASRIAVEEAKGILRICWESNGSMSTNFIKEAAALSLESGGTIKFDFKARDENLHFALYGVSNRQTLKNFEWLAEYGRQRSSPPDREHSSNPGLRRC